MLIRRSDASKIGPIPATYVERKTCPVYCPWKHQGCYARCNLHIFHAQNRARREGLTVWELERSLEPIPDRTMFRWGIAGDLPGNGRTINPTQLVTLARSVRRLKAWAYTHYLTPPPGDTVRSFTRGNARWSWGAANLRAVAAAQAAGLTVNLSADSPRLADQLSELGVAPVATVLPRHVRGRISTPAGRRIRVCPAVVSRKVTCSTCGFCANKEPNRAIVGFPAHGSQWRAVDRRVRASA